MSTLTPLETLYQQDRGEEVPLPAALANLYGRLRMPAAAGRAHVFGNFVTTLDGVVSLDRGGRTGGGEISGFNQHDRMVMGILRSVADAVVVGAGTLRSVPQHLWAAEYIYPPLAPEYRALRSGLGKSGTPLNVIVTGRGDVDLSLPVFSSDRVEALIVTGAGGARRLREQTLPPSVRVEVVPGEGSLSASEVLEAVERVRKVERVLVEGGPHLMGDFLAEGMLDELFLTLAPQVAGREGDSRRPGFVAGREFAPENPLWGTLVAVRRGESHLFLRYSFRRAEE